MRGLPCFQSDFERAFASTFGAKNRQVLSEQYRMAEPICDLVTKTFYAPHGVRLETSVCVENLVRIDLMGESLNVGRDGRAALLLSDAVGLAVQVEEPT